MKVFNDFDQLFLKKSLLETIFLPILSVLEAFFATIRRANAWRDPRAFGSSQG